MKIVFMDKKWVFTPVCALFGFFPSNGDIIILLNLDLNFAGNNNASGSMIDDKSKQWFGASVHSSGPDGIIVVNLNVLIGENNLALSVLL